MVASMVSSSSGRVSELLVRNVHHREHARVRDDARTPRERRGGDSQLVVAILDADYLRARGQEASERQALADTDIDVSSGSGTHELVPHCCEPTGDEALHDGIARR